MSSNYFAYGSNMHPDRMARRCPRARAVGIADLDGYSVRIGHRGVATVIHAPAQRTVGVVWEVSDDDLTTLDRVEGVDLGLYHREYVEVSVHGSRKSAVTYVEPFMGPAAPRPGYLELIIEGARHFGIEPTYLAMLARLGTGASLR